MQKSGLKEPIYLTKLKRKSKIIEQLPQRNEITKENLIYDLHVLQQPSSAQKMKEGNQQNEKLSEHAFPSQNYNRHQSVGLNFVGSRQGRSNNYKILDASSQSSLFKDIIQNISNSSLEHNSKLFFQSKKISNKQNTILDQPQLVNLKARAIKTINSCKADILNEIKWFQINNNDQSLHKVCDREKNKTEVLKMNQSCMTKCQKEQKIIMLEQKNRFLENRVQYLEMKLKEKELVQMRVLKIQKDLSQLYEYNQELQRSNQQLSRSQIKSNNIQAQIQTQYFPLYVKDSYCQTFIQDPQFRGSTTFERGIQQFPNEDLFNRAKLWKNQLQRQKMAAINRQAQFKVAFDNLQIEYRQKVDMMHKQLQLATMKYDRKCVQIKQKQGIINKYLLQKPL